MENPVVFLAFANDDDSHLPLLDEERRVISDHLLPLANNNFIQLFVEPGVRTEDLTRYITDFKDRIAIFHYGGHAESNYLLFEDQEANAEGVAQLLALQSNLKLVFLNGCSTLDQVKLLFDLGIPAVIATSVPIADPSAKAFSDAFYNALASNHTIEESFKIAASNHQMKSGTMPTINRGFGRQASGLVSVLPWGLYTKEDESNILDWKIPRQQASSFIIRNAGMSYGRNVSMNEKLVETIANTIAPYSERVQSLVAETKRRRRKASLRDLRVAVIDSFPTPLGTHLRKLILSEEISPKRLQSIVNEYSVATQMLCYVMLAQLWDEKHHKETFEVPDEYKQPLKVFFELSPAELPTYDYVQLIKTIGDLFNINNIEPFLTEFAQMRKEFYSDSEFYQAYLFLEEMKKELLTPIDANEIESFCVQAEEKLCELFKHVGFSANYTMVAVKNIEILKERHNDASFAHNLVILDRITASFGILDETFTHNEFVENNAVILLKDEASIDPYLNLSPFIIDENALSGQHNSKIFFLRHAAQQKVQYILTDNLRDLLDINEDQYPEVYQQVVLFKRLVLE